MATNAEIKANITKFVRAQRSHILTDDVAQILDDMVDNIDAGGAGVPLYLKWAANIAQSNITTNDGLLVVGKQYYIQTLNPGDDFANVGYVADETIFTATGTTPTVWTNNTTLYNATDNVDPVYTSLDSDGNPNPFEDTIGITEMVYVGIGHYQIKSAGKFIENKTFIVNQMMATWLEQFDGVALNWVDVNTIDVKTMAEAGPLDGLLGVAGYFSSFEIRVYP